MRENKARKCGAEWTLKEAGKDYGASTAMTERAVIAVPI